ncbi:hypothetical protein EYF80_051547 [Liparis tanakae]|uniref:Uncharacterized protein n=1 Tax=Liparis tanakae TaxID=230148 RepID=A0A4Z2FD36_9TELE|nr:hypothetical protein EYF80_051547 [Liparis tanakae]
MQGEGEGEMFTHRPEPCAKAGAQDGLHPPVAPVLSDAAPAARALPERLETPDCMALDSQSLMNCLTVTIQSSDTAHS